MIWAVWEIVRGADPNTIADNFKSMMAKPAAFILFAACAQLAFALAAVVPAWLSPVPLRERLGLLPVQTSRSIYPLAMLGSLAPLAVGFAIAHAFASLLRGNPTSMELFENLTPVSYVAFILFIATVPAVVEELLFRGYVQRRLLQRWKPAWAIAITATLFALMHVMPLDVVALFPFSLWLGVVAWKTGSVFPGMLCHAFVNGGVNVWRMIVRFAEISPTTQVIVVTAILLLSTACFVNSLRIFRQQDTASDEPSTTLKATETASV
jgi:membrane protease YdiL (CAAX protease family)